MANRGRPSVNKRRKEEGRRLHQEKKVERRAARLTEARSRPTSETSEERDLAGIIPGPQPPRDDED